MQKQRTTARREPKRHARPGRFWRTIQDFFSEVTAWDVACAILILLLFIAGLAALDHPLGAEDGDSVRDFAVAREIARGNILPHTGPWNGAFGGTLNSPLYYYLLAPFLLFGGSYMFLNQVNVLIFCLSILLVFLIGRAALSSVAGFLGALLFAFHPNALTQAAYIWQPHVMYPFFLVALLLLILSSKKGDGRFAVAATASATIAGALHNAAFTILPVVVGITIFLLHKQQAKARTYGIALLVSGGVFAALYLPLLFAPAADVALSGITSSEVPVEFPDRFQEAVHAFFDMLFLRHGTVGALFGSITTAAVLAAAVFLRDARLKWFLIASILFAAQPVIATAMIPLTTLHGHYFAVALAPLTLGAGGAIAALTAANGAQRMLLAPRLIGVALTLLLFPYIALGVAQSPLLPEAETNVRHEEYISRAVSAMSQSILASEKSGRYEAFPFFRVVAYKQGTHGIHNLTFVLPLEETLGTTLVRPGNDGSIKVASGDQQTYLVCIGETDPAFLRDGCRQHFFFRSHTTQEGVGGSACINTMYREGPIVVYLIDQTRDIGACSS